MYTLLIRDKDKSITSVIPATLDAFNKLYRGKAPDGFTYGWLDKTAFTADMDVGDFLQHPYNYSFIKGRDDFENRLIKKAIASAKTQPIENIDGVANIPDWANYLAIKCLVSAGGAGSKTMKGGGGAYVKDIVLSLDKSRTLRLSLGSPGRFDPSKISQDSGTELLMTIDDNITYKFSGGVGATDDASGINVTSGQLYNPIAGSGGFWETAIGGNVFNGVYRSTNGPINGYGGGGDLNSDGQPAYLDAYWSDIRPAIDGPLLNVDSIAGMVGSNPPGYSIKYVCGLGTTIVNISNTTNYICVLYACAGGGYGTDKLIGGQGASVLATWWRVYPGDYIHVDVGGSGSNTQATYYHKNVAYQLFDLEGGQGPNGGRILAGSGSNMFHGFYQSKHTPVGIPRDDDVFGHGGDLNQAGGVGTMAYIFSSLPPKGVTTYDPFTGPTYLDTYK